VLPQSYIRRMTAKPPPKPENVAATKSKPAPPAAKPASPPKPVAETGGPTGPEPTRYGDWEKNGRCIDF
jgi:hypothetical protein